MCQYHRLHFFPRIRAFPLASASSSLLGLPVLVSTGLYKRRQVRIGLRRIQTKTKYKYKFKKITPVLGFSFAVYMTTPLYPFTASYSYDRDCGPSFPAATLHVYIVGGSWLGLLDRSVIYAVFLARIPRDVIQFVFFGS